jgi:hypothetical protein
MTEPSVIDKRKNKNFVIQNKYYLKTYGLKNYEIFGKGIIVINLLMLDCEILNRDDVENYQAENEKEITLQQPLAYVPETNFWFKVLYLKIKKKHQIDIKHKNDSTNNLLIIFIKDVSVEHFSIYSIKTD